MQGTRGRGHSQRCLLLSLSIFLSLCEREGQVVAVFFFRRCTWPRPTAAASLYVRRAWYCAWPRCVCVNVPVYAYKWVSVFLCGCVRLSAAVGGTGLPVCACARVCACVSDSLLSLGVGVGLPLPLSHTHSHMPRAVGRAAA
jgi:hypothetical protein